MLSQELKDALSFDVEIRKAQDLFSGFEFTDSRDHVVFAPGTNKVLNLCSKDYGVVTNQQLVDPAHKLLSSLYGAKHISVSYEVIADRKFYISLAVGNEALAVQAGDPLNFTIEIQNSYDGTLKHSYALGYKRLVCTNGLMAFKSEIKGQWKHNRNFAYDPASVLRQIEGELATVDKRIERFRKLTERRLFPAEVQELTARVLSKTKFPKKMAVDVASVAYGEAERLNVPMSRWLLYNGFNYQLNHAPTALHPEQKDDIDVAVLRILEPAG